ENDALWRYRNRCWRGLRVHSEWCYSSCGRRPSRRRWRGGDRWFVPVYWSITIGPSRRRRWLRDRTSPSLRHEFAGVNRPMNHEHRKSRLPSAAMVMIALGASVLVLGGARAQVEGSEHVGVILASFGLL